MSKENRPQNYEQVRQLFSQYVNRIGVVRYEICMKEKELKLLLDDAQRYARLAAKFKEKEHGQESSGNPPQEGPPQDSGRPGERKVLGEIG